MPDAPARKTWAGNMFEQVCKDHIGQVKQKIGILGILSNESRLYFSLKITPVLIKCNLGRHLMNRNVKKIRKQSMAYQSVHVNY